MSLHERRDPAKNKIDVRKVQTCRFSETGPASPLKILEPWRRQLRSVPGIPSLDSIIYKSRDRSGFHGRLQSVPQTNEKFWKAKPSVPCERECRNENSKLTNRRFRVCGSYDFIFAFSLGRRFQSVPCGREH